ncbi:MAG: tetratricopeptide repeat protein, partial [bacterium]|nr:tetratricopeptide repeat protein [bacterium]
AEKIYRSILQHDPRNAKVLDLMSILAFQVKKYDHAAEFSKKAIEFNNRVPGFYLNFGNSQMKLGNHAAALDAYEHFFENNPTLGEAAYNCGLAHKGIGNAEQAVSCFKEAIRLAPDYAPAYNNLGIAYNDQGERESALEQFKEALRVQPGYAHAHNNLANLLRDAGKKKRALYHYRLALQHDPEYGEAHFNLGAVLIHDEQHDEALEHFSEALRLKPGSAELHSRLGKVFLKAGKPSQAFNNFDEAIRLDPAAFDSYMGMALLHKEKNDYTAALEYVLQADERDPGRADVLSISAGIKAAQGHLEEAYELFSKVFETQPDSEAAHTNYLMHLNYHAHIDREYLFAEHEKWEAAQCRDVEKYNQYANSLSKHKRLRIGYVSPDFCWHSVAYFIEPVIAAHNRNACEIYCYSAV